MKDTLTFDQLPEAVTKMQEKLNKIEQLLLQRNEQSPEQDEIMSVGKAAIFLDLAVPTVYSKVCRKELPVNKRGKRLYFYRSELTEWIRSGRKRTAEEIMNEATAQLSVSRKTPKLI